MLLWLVGGVLALVVLVVVALQFPKTQNFIAHQAADYLQKTLQTEVRIGGFHTDFRKAAVFTDVYLEDQQGDTLWYSQRLGLDLKFSDLLRQKITISEVELRNATGHLRIAADSSANYDFILEAFAADTATAQPADTTGAWDIDLESVDLRQIFFTLTDATTGQNVRARIGHFETEFTEFDLEKSRFYIGDITLRNSSAEVVQTKVPPEEEPEPLTVDFDFKRLLLDSLTFHYRNTVAAQRIDLNLGQAEITANKVNLAQARIHLGKASLANTTVAYAQNMDLPADSLAINPARTARQLDKAAEKQQGRSLNWVVTLDNLSTANVQASVDDFDAPAQPRGMDFNHLLFSDLGLKASGLYLSLNRVEADIDQLQVREKSGFRIEQLTTDLTYDSLHTHLANLDLRTGESRLHRDILLRYPSVAAFASNLGAVVIEADITNTFLGLQDLFYFQPELAQDPAFRALARSGLRVEGEIEGPISDLQLRNLQARGLQGTDIALSGRIKGLPESANPYMDLRIARLQTTRTDVQALLPAGVLPANITLPERITVNGTFTGTLTAFSADLTAKTSLGNLVAKVDLDQRAGTGRERFSGTVSATNLQLGTILQDPTLGPLTGQAKFSGTGLDPASMRAQVDAQVQEMRYNGTPYNDISLQATIDHNVVDLQANSNDNNLGFALSGRFDLRDPKKPLYNLDVDLQQLDLQALGLYDEPMQLQGKIKTDLSGLDAGSLSGTVTGQDLRILTKGQVFRIDSLYLSITQQPGLTRLTLRSDIANGTFKSGNSLAELPLALEQFVSSYFRLQDQPYARQVALQDFDLEMRVRKTELITAFVPGLERLRVGQVKGSYRSASRDLDLEARVPLLVYTGYRVDSLTLKLDSDPSRLNYTVTARQAGDSTLRLDNLTIAGFAANNELTTRLAVAETKDQEKMVLGGVLTRAANDFRFRIAPDQLVLNGEKWNVTPNNYLQFGEAGVYANNVRLERGPSALTLNSLGPEGSLNAPLQIAFQRVEIRDLLHAIERSDSLASGTLNGEVTLRNLTASPTFTSDLTVTGFAFQGIPLGDIALRADTPGGERYNVDLRLTGNGNNVTATGYYLNQGDTAPISFNVNIEQLNLAALEGFTGGQLRRMRGGATGQLQIGGLATRPEVRGELLFRQAAFNVALVNADFRLPNERLVFDETGIQFPNVTVLDSAGNRAQVNGAILTSNYVDYRFNLDLHTDRFVAMNSTAKDNPDYYGKLIVTSNARMRGPLLQPVARGEVKVLNGSALTIVLPTDEGGALEREGIVEFIDVDAMALNTEKDSVNTGVTGMDVLAEIEVDEQVPFTVVIDPVSGDHLQVRGSGQLSAGIDPSGKMSLSGRYEVDQGEYVMTFYNIVKREFDLQKGSYITWYGDPLDAQMDVTAIYRTKAPAMELVVDQLQGGASENSQFRQQLPFEVLIDLDGDLMKPDIDFDIQLAESERAAFGGQVEARLQMLRNDEAALNQQVFALLVLNRFMAEDPLASSGGGLSASARSSVSQVLSQQLNQLTGQYLGGLGLEFGVESYEDYSTGEAQGRTELNVALRQQLFSNRLEVRVGTGTDIEGGSRTEAGTNTRTGTSGFAGDVSVEYKVIPDGRLRLQAFRRNEYAGFLEGELQETGIGLIYSREYNRFKELFSKKKDPKAQPKPKERPKDKDKQKQKELARTEGSK